jgi:putative endonuclease
MPVFPRYVIPADAGIQGRSVARETATMYYVYILASRKNGTLYIGMTSDLMKRIYQHKNDLVKGFTKKYSVHTLVYFEQTADVQAALRREKQLKSWKRDWKMRLIEESNPGWHDLYDTLA